MKLSKVRNVMWHYKMRFLSTEEIFTEIFIKNKWKGEGSRSGRGSDLDQTEVLRKEITKLFEELKIKTLLDIPCGDFNWMKEINLSSIAYTGADIVENIVKQNMNKYASKNQNFLKLNILEDKLPTVDLILCRDLLQHFSYSDIQRAIKNIMKSKSKFLLTSSQLATKKNKDIATGGYRPFNLLLAPFSFPNPLKILDEKNPTLEDSDKNLLLWKIESLKDL